jgi:hypothetical protein
MANNRQFYDSYRWRVKTSPLVRKCNPVCQRILDDGKQCEKPSEIVHHLIDPTRNPKLAHDWSNLVATCATHHPAGTPGETKGYLYCATIAPLEAIYRHPGGLLPAWHPKYVAPAVGDPRWQHKATATTVGDDTLNAALGSQEQLDQLLAGL